MTILREYIREAIESAPVRMRLDMPIPADLRAIHEIFQDTGQELYIVGGAVRDVLLDKTPKDYDLATGATPDVVQDILGQDPSNKVDLTGKSFGVVRVWTPGGNEYEIATFRRDIGSGRRPDAVEFTSIEDDVKRRDLTINALFYDMDSGEVVDYVGGIEDVKSGVIKAVGDPKQRFGEDRLRILRAVRFAGRLGSDLDPETEKAILQDNDLSGVSPERIRDEVVKGMSQTQDVGHFLGMLADLNLYPQVLPDLHVNSGTGTDSRDVPVQLALMLSDNDPDQVRSVLRNMKYTNDEVSAVNFLMRFPNITRDTAPGMKKEFNRIKLDPNRLEEFGRSVGVEQRIIPAFLKFVIASQAADPRDLMSQGLKGPEIGSAIQSAESEAYAKMLGELRKYVKGVLIETVITGRKLDRYTTVIRRHVIRAIKDPEVREYFSDTGAAIFKLQDVPELNDIDYLRDVIISMQEGDAYSASAAYEFDLDATPEQRETSDLKVNLVLPRDFKDQTLSYINEELTDALRHELEHSGQDIDELMDCISNLTAASDIWKSFKNATEYYLCPTEVKAHVAGFMKRAKSNKEPLPDVIDYELYRIYQTGLDAGHSEEGLHELMTMMRETYHQYALQRYPNIRSYSTQ